MIKDQKGNTVVEGVNVIEWLKCHAEVQVIMVLPRINVAVIYV